MRKGVILGATAIGLSFTTPVMAQENSNHSSATSAEAGAKELDEFSKIFSSVYKKDDTPIDPVLLTKGERIAGAVVPKGSYRKIMAETFKKVVGPMMESVDAIPLSTIAGFAGVSEEDVSLKEGAKLSDLMEIVDPYYKQRNRAMMGRITDIMIDLSDDMEPTIRRGMARAYARRFSADELEAAANFYETDAGAKIAGESLAIFSSPEVMSASMEMMPQFMEQFFGAMEEITKGSGDIPPPRNFGDLTEAEKEKLSELMGIDRAQMTGPVSNGEDTAADFDVSEDATAAVE